jgi:hypothetical protein
VEAVPSNKYNWMWPRNAKRYSKTKRHIGVVLRKL